jgi:hypothetical protein
MARFNPGRSAADAVRAVTSIDWTDKLKRAASSLKSDYEAGRRGDGTPTTPLWPSPKEQFERLVRLVQSARPGWDTDADEVAEAVRGIDWTAVRQATSQRTSAVAQRMRAMAEDVDWAKVQPVAARLSSALIAAVASGQLSVGGRLGTMVARAIADQAGFGDRVAHQLREDPPPDFREVIDTTAREV